MYSRGVYKRIPACLVVFALTACSTASFYDRPNCPEEAMAEWHIPAAWYQRAVTPEKAHEQVLTGNLGVDAIRDRWQQLHQKWRDGDQYWRYRRPEEPWINPLGWQEGIVLNRGCRQLGFVTTSVQVDEDSATARH